MEKFHKFGRRKVILFFASFFSLMIMVFMACRKDLNQPNIESKMNHSSDIELAKKWFDNNTLNKDFTIGKTVRGKLESKWDKAVKTKNLVDVPFTIDGKGLSRHIPKGYQDGRLSLSLFSDSKGGFKGFVIAISPSKTFTEPVKNINMLNFKQKGFDGIISVYSLEGEYIDGYLVKKGQVYSKIKPNKNGMNSRTTSLTGNCGYEEVCELYSEYWCQCVCQGSNYSCQSGLGCTEPICTVSGEFITCFMIPIPCDDGGGDCPNPEYPNCGNCPDPSNPNCSDCPGMPWCDDGGGGDCLDGNCADTVDELPYYGDTCPSSFNYSTVGNSYRCQVNKVAHGYLYLDNNFHVHETWVTLNSMCINVPKQTKRGQNITPSQAAQFTADALDEARRNVEDQYTQHMNSGTTFNAYEIFRLSFESTLKLYFQNPNGVSVDFSSCEVGSVTPANNQFEFFGACVGWWDQGEPVMNHSGINTSTRN